MAISSLGLSSPWLVRYPAAAPSAINCSFSYDVLPGVPFFFFFGISYLRHSFNFARPLTNSVSYRAALFPRRALSTSDDVFVLPSYFLIFYVPNPKLIGFFLRKPTPPISGVAVGRRLMPAHGFRFRFLPLPCSSPFPLLRDVLSFRGNVHVGVPLLSFSVLGARHTSSNSTTQEPFLGTCLLHLPVPQFWACK